MSFCFILETGWFGFGRTRDGILPASWRLGVIRVRAGRGLLDEAIKRRMKK
jgi:hypothetical protein